MMVRLLGASALALTLTTAAAQAAHRHHYAGFLGYRHVYVSRYAAVRHRGGYGRHWTGIGAAHGHGYAVTLGRRGRAWGEDFAEHRTFASTHVSGGRPRAWCGWYARGLVGRDPGPEYNLARNWTHWGHAAGPGVGVMVVWSHHVGMITGRAPNGQWIVKSG